MPPFFTYFLFCSAHIPISAAALAPHLWSDAGEGLCRRPISHAIRPSMVDWNNSDMIEIFIYVIQTLLNQTSAAISIIALCIA